MAYRNEAVFGLYNSEADLVDASEQLKRNGFRPADLSSAINSLDAAYLPLVVLEAAGVPLDASFAEQKRIFQRCNGLFYLCASGAEARRFNRLLIDAGMINRL